MRGCEEGEKGRRNARNARMFSVESYQWVVAHRRRRLPKLLGVHVWAQMPGNTFPEGTSRHSFELFLTQYSHAIFWPEIYSGIPLLF